MKTRVATISAALLLCAAYLLNLGSLYAPTNGDEMVYLHIARLTAESGHWLPLVSDLQTPSGGEMRNTKPPLLFWQAMLAGQWGWDLWVLRLPYVLQTLMCAGLIAFVAFAVQRRVGAQPISRTLAQQSLPLVGTSTSEREWREVTAAPLLAAALFLGFFSTYRYGRPVLPSSSESLFLFALCALVILLLMARKPHPTWLATGAGLLMIPALLVKSFVLAAPVGLWLFAALWLTHSPFGLSLPKASLQKLWQSAWPSTLAVLIGLAGFALWFALDPNPAAVWREFIIGENFSTKFSESRSDSLLSIALAPFLNAGLLAPLVLGLCWVAGTDALQAMRQKAFSPTSMPEKLLWLWIAAWLLVFAIPSQRSARYVIPVMPAAAVLLALYAPRINRVWWMLTLGLIAVAMGALGWIAYALAEVVSYSPVYFVAMALVIALCLLGMIAQRYRVALTAVCTVAWLALLGALAMPFDDKAGRFDAATAAQLAGKTVLAPQNFNAQFERFKFILPASQPLPYAASQGLPADFVAGDLLASRLVLRSRHAPDEVTWSALSTRGGIQKLLIEREVLVLRRP